VAKMQRNHTRQTHETGCKKPKPKNHTVEVLSRREKKTVSASLKEGPLNSLDLLGLGQIVEKKDLEQYLKNKESDSACV
jgi:hypothetical protein